MQEEKKKQDSFAELQQSLAQSQDRRAWDQFQWQKTNDMADNLRADEKLDLEKDHKEQALTLDYRKFDWQMMVDVEEVKIEKSQRRPTLVGNK